MIDKTSHFGTDYKAENHNAIYPIFPNPPKTNILITPASMKWKKHDPYAALLCSEHYVVSLWMIGEEESQIVFNTNERERQHRIIQLLDNY
ncbi:hypothetical protein [Lentibacillus sp. CBA3610]|uniref:hypothetical protein n=1 Tax=Lentibacillus sp. CBA3610 TaxID=2518176 RepID=UPI00159594A5|nr:hypothetical protein [Lentibacillus sp. CBA3610]